MSLRKSLPLLLLALASAAIACLPGPSDSLEYVHLSESVIIQKVTAVPSTVDEGVAQACRMPEFTLYGDGTLLFREREGASFAPELRETTLDESKITSLLESIDHDGFFVFPYDIRSTLGPSPNETFLYIQTKERANAVRVSGSRVATDDESDDLKAARSIAQRLDEVVAAVEQPREFQTDVALLIARPFDSDDGRLPAWDGPVELATLTGNEYATRQVQGEAARGLLEAQTVGAVRVVEEDGQAYTVCARPLLPHEQNFPEFDTT